MMEEELEAIVPPLLGLDDDGIEQDWDAFEVSEIVCSAAVKAGDWPEELF